MTQDPRPPVIHTREEHHTVTREPNYGGYALVAVLVVLAVLFVVWMMGNQPADEGDTGNTNPTIVETTLPEGTITSP